jgi:hypothetical protein
METSIRTKRLNPALFALVLMAFAPAFSFAAIEQTRQEAVAQRGGDVMPFDLQATTHIFTKTATGGVQQVIAKNADDARQIDLIRLHLQHIAAEFSKGDFSGPSHIHGAGMPGLAELKAAKPSELSIRYREVNAGGEIVFDSSKQDLVQAVHRWFDAQLSDHGSDAMQGHVHDQMHH